MLGERAREELERGCRRLVSLASPALDRDQLGLVEDFVDHNEFGLAVETLAELMPASALNDDMVSVFRSLAEVMPLDPEIMSRVLT